MQDAPPIGRPSKTITIDKLQVRVTQASVRAAYRMGYTVVRKVGRPVLQAVLDPQGRTVVPEDGGDPYVVPLKDMLKIESLRPRLLDLAFDILEDIEPDEFCKLSDDLVIGNVEVNVQGAWISLTSRDLIDEMVPDPVTLFTIVRAAAEVTLLPFVGSLTSGGSSTDTTASATASPRR